MCVALIDGDILLWQCVSVTDDEELLKSALQEKVDKIMTDTKTDGFLGFLTGESNFRKALFPSYKANRKDRWEPELLSYGRTILLKMGFYLVEGAEADDAISLAVSSFLDSIICSTDKDFLQVPGKKYNLTTGEQQEVTEEQAEKNFWLSMLTGDRTDNIGGIYGIGKVKGSRHLDGFVIEDLPKAVFELYVGIHGGTKEFKENYIMLRLLRGKCELPAVCSYARTD